LQPVKQTDHNMDEELGTLEAMRFMSLSRERKIDSVKRHRAWQKKLDKTQFVIEVFQ
jgi:hypothetical protein